MHGPVHVKVWLQVWKKCGYKCGHKCGSGTDAGVVVSVGVGINGPIIRLHIEWLDGTGQDLNIAVHVIDNVYISTLSP